MQTLQQFSKQNFISICKQLSKKDADLKRVIDENGYPPMWQRKANFETLIHIILEQQVSLAAAMAALKKLKEKLGTITPVKFLALSDEDLRRCYFSRQKIIYTRHLAEAILNKNLSLKKLPTTPDETVRTELLKIKGIGNWTADVYLMMVLQRSDLFPAGDIALIKSIKEVKQLHQHTSKEEILQLAENWRPYRTVAAFILWHAYLCKRKKK